jgi:hypothetical protein
VPTIKRKAQLLIVASVLASVTGCGPYQIHDHEAARAKSEQSVALCQLDPACSEKSDSMKRFPGGSPSR